MMFGVVGLLFGTDLGFEISDLGFCCLGLWVCCLGRIWDLRLLIWDFVVWGFAVWGLEFLGVGRLTSLLAVCWRWSPSAPEIKSFKNQKNQCFKGF